MAKAPQSRFSLLGWLVAAVTAPALAGGITSVILFFVETLPFLLSGSAPPDSLSQELLGLVRDLILGPLLSVPLGFVGACIFLAPAFFLAEIQPRPWLFVVAGGAAGTLHAISGAVLAPLNAAPAWLAVALGYLPYAFRPAATLAFGFGAAGAGSIAGYVYARIRTVKKPGLWPAWKGI